MEERVILVDDQDNEQGTLEKMEAHRTPTLHRAFSIFIFDNEGRMLLQRRAADKYHSPGLWTNTCCSHPRPGETVYEAAGRRLQEEMGFSTPLTRAFEFIYKAEFDNGLSEYEYDHVLIGSFEGSIQPNEHEVDSHCYKSFSEIKTGIHHRPWLYTEWFKIALPKLEAFMVDTDMFVV